jgi:hypothetical protein
VGSASEAELVQSISIQSSVIAMGFSLLSGDPSAYMLVIWRWGTHQSEVFGAVPMRPRPIPDAAVLIRVRSTSRL